jgi:Tol biopolymer transport system component
MNDRVSTHLLSARGIRIAAASAALILIAIGVVVTSGSGGDGGGSSSSRAQQGESPPARDPESHEHFSNIYVLDLGSRRIKRVTSYQLAQQPTWSPSKRIGFSSAECDDECYAKLFYIDARGRDQVLVPAKKARHLFHPTWSPDGRSMAAVALGRGIYTVSLDRKTRRLTSGQSDEAPAWSPRSDWIAFDKQLEGTTNYDLFAVNAVTGKTRRLTRDRLQQTNPSWSPDGSRLAFAQQGRNGRWAIFTMGADGSDRKRVTRGSASAQEPSWSPDGTKIAYIRQGLDQAWLAVADLDGGTKPRILTGKRLFAANPAWSPDGRQIAFSATENK